MPVAKTASVIFRGMSKIAPKNLTRRKIADAKRDLVLQAGKRLAAMMGPGMGIGTDRERIERDVVVEAVLAWVKAERGTVDRE